MPRQRAAGAVGAPRAARRRARAREREARPTHRAADDCGARARLARGRRRQQRQQRRGPRRAHGWHPRGEAHAAQRSARGERVRVGRMYIWGCSSVPPASRPARRAPRRPQRPIGASHTSLKTCTSKLMTARADAPHPASAGVGGARPRIGSISVSGTRVASVCLRAPRSRPLPLGPPCRRSRRRIARYGGMRGLPGAAIARRGRPRTAAELVSL